MDRNPAAAKFSLKIQLGRSRDFCRATERDAAFGEKADGEINQRFSFGQFQTAQSFIVDFDYHDITVSVAVACGKRRGATTLVSSTGPSAWERRRPAGSLLDGIEEHADGTPALPGKVRGSVEWRLWSLCLPTTSARANNPRQPFLPLAPCAHCICL